MEITAMQELIEYIESNEIVYNKDLILKLKELLEKEKEQMIDFYTWMRRNDSAEEYFHYSDEDMLEEYYNIHQ
jgi:capsule polysaccharide export protein KpsE/RkpR